MEDTSQCTMKNRFVYVVKDKMTVPYVFCRGGRHQKHFNDYVILNICESSTTSDLNEMGLLFLATKTQYKHLWEIDGIWFHVVFLRTKSC